MKILIADESQLVRERYVTLFAEQKGIDIVGFANSAGEALASVETLKPAAVILDTRLSDGKGLDVLRSIKKLQSAPVVLVLTNELYPQYRNACIQAGADYLFDKATEFTKVNDVLQLLNQQASLREKP